jgi:hypothetical protein
MILDSASACRPTGSTPRAAGAPAPAERLPTPITLTTGARVSPIGLSGRFIPAPFRFCVSCGAAHGAIQRADFGKLSPLGAGGRSTSTTVLGLSAVRQLRGDDELYPEARTLLSFSDNRQDASLQAGVQALIRFWI